MHKNEWDAAYPRMPLLNQAAPDFEAMTTAGVIKLSDYQGRWVILFAHPADFTPVCTSEIIALSENYKRFKDANCELLGLSVDSRFAHIAWLRGIKKQFNIDVPFPVIDDQRMNVAGLYGMVHPAASDTSAVRAAFFIDDKGVLRAMIYYPMTVGRSVREILRVLLALQTADRLGVALPEGWKPGDPAVELPPDTVLEAQRRSSNDTSIDWYYSRYEMVKVKKSSRTEKTV